MTAESERGPHAPLRRCAGLLLAMASGSAAALGLGEPEVRSALGQPLDVRIPLQLADSERADALEFRLADNRAYEPLGLQPPRFDTAAARVEVVSEDGAHWLRLSAPRRVSEPLVVLMLEARNGPVRFVRELTLMFEVAPAGEVATRRPVQRPVEAATAAPLAAPAAPKVPAAPAVPVTAPAATDGRTTYGPVAGGETLRSIAERVRPEPRFGIRRVMTALLRANPEAFADGHTLAAGTILAVPTPREMLALDDELITASVGPRGAALARRELATATAAAVAAPAPAAAVEARVPAAAHIAPVVLTRPSMPAPLPVRTPLGTLQLSAGLSPVSLARLSAGEAVGSPAPAVADERRGAAETAEPVEADVVAGPAFEPAVDAAVEPLAAATTVEATPAAARVASASETGGGWIGWLIAAVIAAGIALWRRARGAGAAGPTAVRVPAAATPAVIAAPVPVPVPVPAPAATPPLRVVGGLEAGESGKILVLRQSADRLARSSEDAVVRRKLTLLHAYLDNADVEAATQLMGEIEQLARGPRAVSGG